MRRKRLLLPAALALLAVVPPTTAPAAERVFGATADQLAAPTPGEGADDCSGGCLFASEPEHGPLSGLTFQPPDMGATFPIRLDRAEVRLQNGGAHQLALLVLVRSSPTHFTVVDRVPLGSHAGPALVDVPISSPSRTVTAQAGQWIGLHVVHAGPTDLLHRVPGSAKRAVGVDPQPGQSAATDVSYGKNRMLPMRIHASDDAPETFDTENGGVTELDPTAVVVVPPPPPPIADADMQIALVLPRSVPIELAYTGPRAMLPIDVLTTNAGPIPALDAFNRINAIELPRGSRLVQDQKSYDGIPRWFCPGGLLLVCDFGRMEPGDQNLQSLEVGLRRNGGRVHLLADTGSATPDPRSDNNEVDLRIDVPVLPASWLRQRLELRRARPRVSATAQGTAAPPRRGPRAAQGGAAARRSGKLQIAIGRRVRRGCAWVGGTGRDRTCRQPTWLDARRMTPKPHRRARARGSARPSREAWVLRLRERLPCGRYVVVTRAIGASGAIESRFRRKDGNRRIVNVKRKRC